MLLVAQGVPRRGVLQPDGGGDITGVHGVDLFPVVGVHLQDPADPFPLALGGVEHIGAGIEGAGIDAEEGQLPDIGVGHDLEGQRRKGLVVAGFPVSLRAVRKLSLDGRHVQRRRQIIDHRVQKELNPFVLVGGAAQDRERSPR